MSRNSLKYDFNHEIPLTGELSELVGAFLGDGCIAGSGKQSFLTGDTVNDREYFDAVIAPICNKLFGFNPSIYVRSDGTSLILMLNSVSVNCFFRERFGVQPNKTHLVKIPSEIMRAPLNIRQACVRGLFDTDGSVFFDLRPVYHKPYVRIFFTSVSYDVIYQASEILSLSGIPNSVTRRRNPIAWGLYVNGKDNCKLFCSKIGFSNTRHLRRLPIDLLEAALF